MKTKVLLIGLFVITQMVSFAQAPQINPDDYPEMVGFWTFDSTDVVKATVGNDLVLTGSHTVIDGPAAGDKAVRIGKGSYYTCTHDIAANGGGAKVNNYSLLFDFKVSQIGRWYSFYQTNPVITSTDGEVFIQASDGAIGRAGSGLGYSDYKVLPQEWYRLIVSVHLDTIDLFLDGHHILHTTGMQTDGEYGLSPANAKNLVYLFADNDGEDNEIDVALAGIFKSGINKETAKALGGYGHDIEDVYIPPTYDFHMHPYLQSSTPTTIYVSWHGYGGASTIVEYGTSESLGQSQSGDFELIGGKNYWHTVKLTGLTPDTEYFYKCKSDDKETEIFKFRTPAEGVPAKGHLRYLLLGDSRPSIFGDNGNRPSEIVEAMTSTVKKLYGDDLHNQIDLVVNVGDIVIRGDNVANFPKEYFGAYESMSANIPFMVAVGNHEQENPSYYKYMKYEDFNNTGTEKYYSFVTDKTQFIMLNSNDTVVRNHPGVQAAWLNAQLDSAENDSSIYMSFVFGHHPGHTELWPDGEVEGGWIRSEVYGALASHPKAQMYSYGHSHCYERGAIESDEENTNGDFYIMLTGGGGSDLDRWGMYSNQKDYPEIQIAFDYYMFNLVDIDLNAKTMDVYTYALGNPINMFDEVKLVDHFYRKLNQPGPEKPVALSIDTTVRRRPKLIASEFVGVDSLMTSQFQITKTPGNYENPMTSKRDWVDFYGDSGAPYYTPINKNEGIDLTSFKVKYNLKVGQTYAWRVRYRDHNLKWSEWSDEKEFTISTPVSATDIENKSQASVYPNPSDGSVTIDFSINKSSDVRIDIINIDGKVIRQFNPAFYSKGKHSVNWNGCDNSGRKIASGNYFVLIQTDRDKKVIKIGRL